MNKRKCDNGIDEENCFYYYFFQMHLQIKNDFLIIIIITYNYNINTWLCVWVKKNSVEKGEVDEFVQKYSQSRFSYLSLDLCINITERQQNNCN